MRANRVQAALFIASASAGDVLHFLARHHPPEEEIELLLSDAKSERRWRALLGPLAYLRSVAGPLSLAFAPETVLTISDSSGWSVLRWREGAAGDPTVESRRPLWTLQGFLRMLRPSSAIASLVRDGFPVMRLTRPPQVIEYDTVAGLERRGLLVENTPRLYRFVLCPKP